MPQRNSRSSRPATSCWWELGIDADLGDDVLVLQLSGEIDMLTLPLVRAALAAAQDHKLARLVVDLSEISFCSVRAFTELTDGAAATPGYTVAGPTPHLARLAVLTGGGIDRVSSAG